MEYLPPSPEPKASNAGSTESERLLSRLCKDSFLTLWSYSNPYTDEGRRNGKGQGKELTDVLVVFGDDVLLFSDKNCKFNSDIPTKVAWQRWFKSAVAKSAQQLFGAMSFIKRFPERVFLDPNCSNRLPAALPPAERARFHLFAVTRGSFEACSRYFNGAPGSHIIHSGIVGERMHLDNPFTVGHLDSEKPFVHVIDEFSLEALFYELTTIRDFLNYIEHRALLLTSKSTIVRADGEEQLLSAFVLNEARGNQGFFANSEPLPDFVNFDGSHFAALHGNPQYLAKKQAEKRSLLFDVLVNSFADTGSTQISPFGTVPRSTDVETGLRVLASEIRFRRRLLIDALDGLMQAGLANEAPQYARIVGSNDPRDPIYILAIVKRRAKEDDETFRLRRRSFVSNYCMCAQLKFRSSERFVGIGFDHPVRDDPRSSEDLVVWIPPPLTDERAEELQALRDRLGILRDDLQVRRYSTQEYPQVQSVSRSGSTRGTAAWAKSKNSKDADRKKKAARKKKKASRRKNRD